MARPIGGYFDKGGARIISNTEALTMTKIRQWSGDPMKFERRREIGKAVHEVTAILDVNKKTLANVNPDWICDHLGYDPEVEPMCRAWDLFKKEHRFTPRKVEHTLFAKTSITQFATTLDREGLIYIGTIGGVEVFFPAIVEIKTPKGCEPYWGIQLAGQELAMMANEGPPRERPFKYMRLVVQLAADGTYKVREYKDRFDRDVFLWALGLATWNVRNYGFRKDS